MMYPAIVVFAMVLIGILMLLFVVPTLTTTFAEIGAELPFATRLIIGISTALTEYAYIALPLVVLLVLGAYYALRVPRGRRVRDYVLLRMPLIRGVVRESNAAATTRTLASLLSSGVEVVHALNVTAEVLQNSYYRATLERAAVTVEKGAPISGAFIERKDIYPVLVGEMIAVGEETGELPKMLENIAEFFEGEVEQKTKDLSTIVEPILMIVIGAGVGFFAYSMILPIYSISESI
jgi:type IV pilus assembly protein PilC